MKKKKSIRSRILNVLRPENGGPRLVSMLRGLAAFHGQSAEFHPTFEKMLAEREIVFVPGNRGGARVKLP